MAEDINPIDDYLFKLQQQKQQVEQRLPGLVEGFNRTFGTNVQIPNGIPLNLSGQQAAGGNLGRVNFAPGANSPRVEPTGTSQFVKDLLSNSMIPGAIPESDAYRRVRQIGFGSTPNENNFQRYYNHPMYNKLGWNPYADNEAIYNQNSTWVDDWSRASSQWGSLAELGFKQTLGNWDDLFTLNTDGDTKYARDMNKMMSIANSSRGGVGGFATNLYANSAYTFGVIGAAVTEEAALWAATALTGGALGETALLRTSTLGKRLFKAAETASQAERLAAQGLNVAESGARINTALNSVNDVSSARKFFNGVGNFLNPLSETASIRNKIKTGADGFDQLSDFAKNAKTFGAFFRDVRLANTTLAESRLEGGMVENEVFNELYSDWMENHDGKAPEGEDLRGILTQSKQAGVSTTLANIPAIFYSNKIVFEKMLNGFKPFRDLRGGLGEMVVDFSAVGKPGKKVFQGFIDPSFYKAFYKKQHFKYAINQFKPKNLMKNGLRYASANLAEGLQESYQEGISSAMKNYYLDTYASPERAGLAYAMEHVRRGFGEQFSGQGAETFLSGFLMGGLVQGPQKLAFQTAPRMVNKAYEKFLDPKAYAETQEREQKRKAQQDRITDFLNEVQADPRKFYDKIYANTQSQKDFSNLMDNAEQAGDQKEFKDVKNDSIFNHISTLMETGYIDLFTDQIEAFKGLDDKELAEAFSYDTTGEQKDELNKDVRSRLDSVLSKVKQIKGLYDKYSTISNPFNGKSSSIDEIIDYQGFEFARKMAIYNEYTFEQNMKRMANIFTDATSANLGNISGSAISFLFSQTSLASMFNAGMRTEGVKEGAKTRLDIEIEQLEEEAKAYAQGTPEQQELGKQKQTQAGQLRQFQQDYYNYVKAYTNAKKSALSEETSSELRKDTTLANKLVAGSNVEYTFKNGNKITGTVVEKKDGKIVIEYLENGKTKRKEVSAKSKLLTLLKGPQNKVEEGSEETAVEKDIDERRKLLGDSLRQYLSTMSGLPVDSVKFDKLIGHMVDYAELGEDSKLIMTTVNLLNDPAKFSLAATAFSQGKKDAFQIAQTNLKKSLETYKARMATNDLLRDLYLKFNVFISPEDIERLVMQDTFPVDFYEMNAKTQEVSPISPASKKYVAILDFLSQESEKEGTILKGRPVEQEAKEVEVYNYVPVEKAPTLNEILAGLGLKPGQKTYTIPVGTLINYVLSERLGSLASRNILQKLLTTLDQSEQIVISLTEGDAYSYSKETGLVIDPRLASREYSREKNGKFMSVSMAHIVTNGLTQMIVNKNLNDLQFQGAIDEVMEAVRQYAEANPEEIQNRRKTYNYAMGSREKFMAMALSDTVFQEYLSRIPYKTQNNNLWKQIIKSIAALLKKLYKGAVPISENALEEVLGIISTKIAGEEVTARQTIKAVKPETKPAGTGITFNTPIEDIETNHPELYNSIVLLSNKDKKRTADELAEWFKKGNPEVQGLLTEYNKLNNLTVSKDEQDEITRKREEQKMENRLALITMIESADKVTLDLIARAHAAPSKLENAGMTRVEFNAYINKRRAELGTELPNFETINHTHILYMKNPEEYENNGEAMVIEPYDPDTQSITVQFGVDGPEETLTRKQFYTSVDKVVTQDEEVEEEPEPEPEEKEASNTNAEASAEQEEEYYSGLYNDSDLKNKDDIEKDLLNNLGCQ